ncbi:hypothetical protein B2K_14570 [Paenibacillus mucilaginosus K02]|uniref:Uncharacterized protein n=1 Tax=Paenibacillus mucilaginosus K02 TaxID=997761 RepID=I0BHS9_9BACL|nr:hypothetical protein B2K_14570 [Paenibacillus mucilaginosus K02]
MAVFLLLCTVETVRCLTLTQLFMRITPAALPLIPRAVLYSILSGFRIYGGMLRESHPLSSFV